METGVNSVRTLRHVHPWLRTVRVSSVPGPATRLLERFTAELLERFRLMGHGLQEVPDERTDLILTTALFGVPIPWRKAVLFSARKRFGLPRSPTVLTLVHVRPEVLERELSRLGEALAKNPPDPADFSFLGLAPDAHRVLIEQGRRGGPILALERVLQAQTMSIRLLLVVGEDEPETVYHFDLVGAHPRSQADDREGLYEDIVLRIVTALSTSEVTEHEVVGEPISRPEWEALTTPRAMRAAGQALGERNFFTEMVRIADLVHVPAVADAVAHQYSEGCFATWEPALGALIATITGSARPVDKGKLTDDELAVIVDVRPGGNGVRVRHVEGKRNDPPSSEAVEMMDMDRSLPWITLGEGWGPSARVPVLRSKLHGHRGVAGYDPRQVEFVPLEPPYYSYPVSCATEAQAQGIKQAFARAESLRSPEDPRQLVFTVLPGHGVVIGEKWVGGKAPFQAIWEAMDRGALQVVNAIPQGALRYVPDGTGRMALREG